MRHVYIVSYDVRDPKRLRRTYDFLRGWGEHLQLSVFRCELGAGELVQVRSGLLDIILATEDQVLFANLGPVDGRGGDSIRTLGLPYVRDERAAVVL